MNSVISYRRIRGTGGSGPFGSVRLYSGDDHLLLVMSSGYSETYKRFYLRDIQAITLRKSDHGRMWNSIWGILVAISIIIALSTGGIALGLWCGIAAVFAIPLGWNIALGPTCRCEIRTAVQSQPVASLNRVARARKVIAELRSMIESVQGRLPADDLMSGRDLSQAAPAPAPDSGKTSSTPL